ncbi:MAG: acetamidase/formamidase family protein [Thermoproteota archaeon]
MTKRIPRTKVIYEFSPDHEPAEYAEAGDEVVFETIDALGGQISEEGETMEQIDWSRVNPATGPLFVRGAEPGDTLVVEVLDIKLADRAVILVVPGSGVLHDKGFKPRAKILEVGGGYVYFDGVAIKARPMIGVIGVAPRDGRYPTGTLGRHGGNMDVSLLTVGTKVYLPVFVRGALLALGDLHAVQADGELCVSAAEVSGEVRVRVDVIKGRAPRYPVLELEDRYAILAYGDDLDEAAYRASEEAVRALMKRYGMSFEDAYMLASLVVDLRVNQVVDPKKGVRAEIPKSYVSLSSLLVEEEV